jgi:hypothetical protein
LSGARVGGPVVAILDIADAPRRLRRLADAFDRTKQSSRYTVF